VLNLPEKLAVYLVDRLYLLAAVTCDKYCIFGWSGGCRILICVCCSDSRIWQTSPRNLEKFDAEIIMLSVLL